MLLIKHFYRFIISILSLCLLTTASYAEPVLGNDTHLGTWFRSCVPTPNAPEDEPTYHTVSVKVDEVGVIIEKKFYIDGNCTKPWVILPEALFKGHYSFGSVRKVDFAERKNVSALPVQITLTSNNNNFVIDPPLTFTAYISENSVYIPAQGEDYPETMTLVRKRVKVRTAEEVYKKSNNKGRAGMACLVTPLSQEVSSTGQWCIDNIDFPEDRFREYCKGIQAKKLMVTIESNCPKQFISYCEYGGETFGYVMRSYYTTEYFKLYPNIEEHCKNLFHGTWFDKDPKGVASGIKIK